MKRATLVAVAAFVAAGAATGRALAKDKYLCCDLTMAQGACTAQSSPCPQELPYGVTLSELPDDAGLTADGEVLVPIPPGDRLAAFPPGIDGYASWQPAGPWIGFCLVAPSASDPKHEAQTEPIGCIDVSLAPGIGASIAQYSFPVDARWDAYELCYGPQMSGAYPCDNANDGNDPTISPTPVTASCCGPAQLLAEVASNDGHEWSVDVGADIPGIPPPVVVYAPDGSITTDPSALGDPNGGVALDPSDASDYLGSYDACLHAYNEPGNCGQPPTNGTSPPSVNTAQGSGSSSDASSGGCSCSSVGNAGGGWLGTALALPLTGLAVALRRRRARRR